MFIFSTAAPVNTYTVTSYAKPHKLSIHVYIYMYAQLMRLYM